MWDFVMRFFRLGLEPGPSVACARPVERQDWNGTILSGETYR